MLLFCENYIPLNKSTLFFFQWKQFYFHYVEGEAFSFRIRGANHQCQSLKLVFVLFFFFFCLQQFFTFYIPTLVPLSSLLPFPISSFPFLTHSSEGMRTSLSSQQGLAYQFEAGPSPFLLYQGWVRYPTIANWLYKASSCTWDQPWSHCQGPHSDQAT